MKPTFPANIRGPANPILLLLPVLLAVAPAAATIAQPLRLGLLLSPGDPLSPSLRQGAELAIQRFNATSPTPAILSIRGTPGQWGSDGNEASRLVFDDDVRLVIAPPDGAASHLVLQVAGRTQTPVLSLCSDSSVTDAGIPWMARTVPSAIDQARLLMTRAPTWAAFVPTERAGREVSSDLRKAANLTGARLDPVVPWPTDPTNALRFAERPDPPQGILLWLPPEQAGRLAATLRHTGYTGLLAGPWWLAAPPFLESASDAARDILLTCPGDSPAPLEGSSTNSREASGSQDKSFDAIAVAAAEAIDLGLQILLQAGHRPVHSVFPIANLPSHEPGGWRFDASGNRVGRLTLRRWTGTHWQSLDPQPPSGSP